MRQVKELSVLMLVVLVAAWVGCSSEDAPNFETTDTGSDVPYRIF